LLKQFDKYKGQEKNQGKQPKNLWKKWNNMLHPIIAGTLDSEATPVSMYIDWLFEHIGFMVTNE